MEKKTTLTEKQSELSELEKLDKLAKQSSLDAYVKLNEQGESRDHKAPIVLDAFFRIHDFLV